MIRHFLWLASDHARLCLVLGLTAGLLLPDLAAMMVPWLPHMVAALLTTTALRIGFKAIRGAVGDLRWGVASVLVVQMVVPLALYLLLWTASLHQTPAALAVLLTASAPAITGSVNLALMMKLDAARMMQILVLGTALFPLTALPVLALLPQLGPAGDVINAALRLLVVIVLAAGVGFVLRAWLFPAPTPEQVKALDGLSVLAFAIIAIGLMAALTPALRADPWIVARWALLAFAISYGMQAIALLVLGPSGLRDVAGILAIGAGNRNIAIYLVALPPEIIGQLMVFIGCWQLPMYLTPLLLPRLYAWVLHND